MKPPCGSKLGASHLTAGADVQLLTTFTFKTSRLRFKTRRIQKLLQNGVETEHQSSAWKFVNRRSLPSSCKRESAVARPWSQNPRSSPEEDGSNTTWYPSGISSGAGRTEQPSPEKQATSKAEHTSTQQDLPDEKGLGLLSVHALG